MVTIRVETRCGIIFMTQMPHLVDTKIPKLRNCAHAALLGP